MAFVFHGCTDVIVNGVNIKGEGRQWVNDGITLRANGKTLVKKDCICENIVVSNCIITSWLDYGIRIGVGDGIIRNCLFTNIIIKNSLSGIGMTCRFSPNGFCTSIENIAFSNMKIDARTALELRISSVQSHPTLINDGYIKNIKFNNVDMNTNRSCYILGFHDVYCSDIEFSNLKLRFMPETRDERMKCNYSDLKDKDSLLYIYHAKNIRFNNLTLENGGFEHDLLEEETENITVD